jgi:diguanylate cyclase (GGDEF)-like protein/PAS domain S-box-containing protein
MNPIAKISCSYNYWLVSLSVALAMAASYAALDVAGRVTSAKGQARILWLSCGAAAMGSGIWAMHYIGMLALTMPIPVAYDVPTVVLSLIAAISASGVALFVVSRPKMGLWQMIAGSVVMGSGIAAMHYVGMAAMQIPVVIVYNRGIAALSVMLAIGISSVALQIAFRIRDEARASRRKLISALVMGAAIPLTHYTGMWAATFYHSMTVPDHRGTLGTSTIGVVAVGVTSFVISGITIASSVFDRFLSHQKGDLSIAQDRELYFRTMAEAVPEIIWTSDPEGMVDYFNQRFIDYTGLSYEQGRGTGWTSIIHPDDLAPCMANWENALRSGEPFVVEYRLRKKDGSYLWFLCRSNPIRGPEGVIVKWFGTCTDIESQKQNMQTLQEEVLERTLQLADANERLQKEMLEKDLARNRLDLQTENMMKELQRRSERATLLAQLGELLQSCISREEVFSAALGFAPKIFPASRGAIALLNPSRNLTDVIGSWTDCQIPAREFEPAECWALRTSHPHQVPAGDSTAPCAHAVGVNVSYLCVPILAQGETLGIMHFQDIDIREGTQIEGAQLSFKTTFAGQVGLSLANIRLRDALHVQSVRDVLTGLYNRRYLEETLEREMRRAARSHQSLGILMIDLDHFKSFNDSYGHDAGDAVLRQTGASLKKGVRAEDFVCRFGGEEFVVVMPTADLKSSCTRAERLRVNMKELTVLHQGKAMGMVTISVGVACFPEHGLSPKELMAAADSALYQAKRAGRDQVVVAAPKVAEDLAIAGASGASDDWGT